MSEKFKDYLAALEKHPDNPNYLWMHRYFLEFGRTIEELEKRIEKLEKENVDS
jgi:hypothetical protein